MVQESPNLLHQLLFSYRSWLLQVEVICSSATERYLMAALLPTTVGTSINCKPLDDYVIRRQACLARALG